jgi:hypothetical protein
MEELVGIGGLMGAVEIADADVDDPYLDGGSVVGRDGDAALKPVEV